MTKIIGNNDGPNGRNDSYKIGNRSKVERTKAVKEVESGQHPGAHIVKIGTYILKSTKPIFQTLSSSRHF